MSLLMGEAAEVALGQKIYVTDGQAVHAFTVRHFNGDGTSSSRPVIFVESSTVAANMTCLTKGSRVSKIDVCEALGTFRFLYKEATAEILRNTILEADDDSPKAGPSQRRDRSSGGGLKVTGKSICI